MRAGKAKNLSKEFKVKLVNLILDGGQTAAEVGKNYGIASSVISTWMKQAKIDAGQKIRWRIEDRGTSRTRCTLYQVNLFHTGSQIWYRVAEEMFRDIFPMD